MNEAGHCEICGGLAHASSVWTIVHEGKFYHRACLINQEKGYIKTVQYCESKEQKVKK
jgi:hypothetical protein